MTFFENVGTKLDNACMKAADKAHRARKTVKRVADSTVYAVSLFPDAFATNWECDKMWDEYEESRKETAAI